jgi:phosphoglycerate dehydrogenase-like enzyme
MSERSLAASLGGRAAVREHRVAVVDGQPGDASRLERLRARVTTSVACGTPDAEEIVRRAHDATVLVTLYTYTTVGSDVLQRLPELGLVATRTAGHSHIDVDAAAALGIAVTAVPDAPTVAVAEYTLGVMLMARRRLAEAAASTRRGAWDFTAFSGTNLAGQTLGVVGLGRIGRRVAMLGDALGMRVLGWSRRPAGLAGVEPVELDELLAGADVVSVNVALTPDTRLLLDARRLALMRPDAFLINTARGEVLDTDALCELLRDGRLGGACLDVVAGEPLKPERALELGRVPNLILTPHISWLTAGTLERQYSGLTDAVLAFCAGEPIDLVPVGDSKPRRQE